jgi:hypothetical protein
MRMFRFVAQHSCVHALLAEVVIHVHVCTVHVCAGMPPGIRNVPGLSYAGEGCRWQAPSTAA